MHAHHQHNHLSFRQVIAILLLVIINSVNVVLIARHGASRRSQEPLSPFRPSSFEGSDYPYTLPVNMSRSVQVAFDAADHYPLLGGKLDRLWTSLTSAGAGYAHLGDHGRILMVTMFHELHCLRALNLALGRYPNITAPHSEHCLSYLRSMTLCSADLTLEPVDLDAMGRIASSRASNATYTCADWGAVYGQMKHDHDSWLKHAATMSRAD